jgi:acyl carrier protein
VSASDNSLVRREWLPLPGRYVAPRTPTETKLAQIWARVLSMDRVGIEDRYHDLGGDSLLATVIFGEIGALFQLEVPLTLLAEAATVAQLAARIDALAQTRGAADRGQS